MDKDEKEIRGIIEKWMAASKDGDTETVLSLMTDDAVFLVPGQEPFGKEEFKKTSEGMKEMKIDGKSEIKEIKILEDYAFVRNHLNVSITTPNGKENKRSGYTLTIFKKENGSWKLYRDANLLTPLNK